MHVERTTFHGLASRLFKRTTLLACGSFATQCVPAAPRVTAGPTWQPTRPLPVLADAPAPQPRTIVPEFGFCGDGDSCEDGLRCIDVAVSPRRGPILDSKGSPYGVRAKACMRGCNCKEWEFCVHWGEAECGFFECAAAVVNLTATPRFSETRAPPSRASCPMLQRVEPELSSIAAATRRCSLGSSVPILRRRLLPPSAPNRRCR